MPSCPYCHELFTTPRISGLIPESRARYYQKAAAIKRQMPRKRRNLGIPEDGAYSNHQTTGRDYPPKRMQDKQLFLLGDRGELHFEEHETVSNALAEPLKPCWADQASDMLGAALTLRLVAYQWTLSRALLCFEQGVAIELFGRPSPNHGLQVAMRVAKWDPAQPAPSGDVLVQKKLSTFDSELVLPKRIGCKLTNATFNSMGAWLVFQGVEDVLWISVLSGTGVPGGVLIGADME